MTGKDTAMLGQLSGVVGAMDLLGTFVFGLSGAMLAVRRDLDLFGILVLSLVAATAGGAVRDVLIGATPAAFLIDQRYFLAALLAGVVVFAAHAPIERMTRPVMVLDALGLGLFAVTGAQKALAYDLGSMGAVWIGVLTACGGGALRDVLVAEVPRVLREEIYALAALLGALVVVLGHWAGWPAGATAVVGAMLASAWRIVGVYRGWQVPRARRR
ncbi:trimeric intracellular cation channel family protein [Pseudooceanicola sediminis]|nr:trimeric intracellular cation channel family protein [Pseudooceanicola sediminis]